VEEGYGFYYTYRGELDKAVPYFLSCIQKHLVLGYVVGAAIALWGISYGLYGQGQKEKALLLLWGAEAMCITRGLVKVPPLYEEYREILEWAKRDMNEETRENIKMLGLQMTLEETVALASSEN
jgi:hypothetical protein